MDIKEIHDWEGLSKASNKTEELEDEKGLKSLWYLSESPKRTGINGSYVVGFKGEYDPLELKEALRRHEKGAETPTKRNMEEK